MLPKGKSASLRPRRSINRRLLLALLIGLALCFWGLVAALLITTSRTGDSTALLGKTSVESSVGDLTATRRQKGETRRDAYEDGAPPVIGIHVAISGGSKDRTTTEIVYAIPSNDDDSKNNIHGIALLLHGCSHSALKFFSPSTFCETCIGLSEEMQIARILLEQHTLAVVAVTSQDRSSGCWSLRDIPHIQDALHYIHHNILNLPMPNVSTSTATERRRKSDAVPVLAFGASSGGRFAAQLAVRQVVSAAMVGVMSLGQDMAKQWSDLEEDKGHHTTTNNSTKKPPIYLAPMPRDKRTAAGAKQDYEVMAMVGSTSQGSSDGHPKNPVLLDSDTCVPMPVTTSYLNGRVPHMKRAMADTIIAVLATSGHLDPASGFLLKDPTKSDWRDILKAQCADQGCLQNQPLGPGVSPLAKTLHRAWAFHEYCSEVTLKALAFFQQELGGQEFFHS